MLSKAPGDGDGLVHELLPLLKNGFLILRSILDVLIDKFEEAEKSRQVDIRKATYESIVDALEAEMESLREKEPDTPLTQAKIEVMEAIISVLLREMEQLESGRHGRRARKVDIG
ncbi:MAG: hypothetical protein Kow0099_30430 [Candidatus Abyssubacteria bacterium]